jgi:hypothetical protein
MLVCCHACRPWWNPSHLLYALVMRYAKSEADKGAAANRSDGSSYKFEAVSLTLKKGKATVTAAAEDEKPPLSDVWDVSLERLSDNNWCNETVQTK